MACPTTFAASRVVSLLRRTAAARAPSAAVPSVSGISSCRLVTAGGVDPIDGEKVIIVYTKETCPLCDGLKDKVQAILDRAPFTGSSLQGYCLEMRDIMSNTEWESRYSMEVPVMAIRTPDGTERVVPRQSPRATADRIEQAIIKSLHQ